MNLTSSLKSCFPLPLGESNQSPITLMDGIEEARIVAKLDIMLAMLHNMIQTYETQTKKRKAISSL